MSKRKQKRWTEQKMKKKSAYMTKTDQQQTGMTREQEMKDINRRRLSHRIFIMSLNAMNLWLNESIHFNTFEANLWKSLIITVLVTVFISKFFNYLFAHSEDDVCHVLVWVRAKRNTIQTQKMHSKDTTLRHTQAHTNNQEIKWRTNTNNIISIQ